jgi:predicted nucleic acid-binding protein
LRSGKGQPVDEGVDLALLDTTVLIDLGRRPGSPLHARAVRATHALLRAGDTLATSRINEAEFRVGIFRAVNRARELATVESILSALVIHEFDAVAAEQYAEVRAQTLDEVRPRGEIDTLIAAIAISVGEPLLTRNPAHFEGLVGLQVVHY